MKKYVVAITGAGISAASNVPTFADMGDVRDKLTREFFQCHPQKLFDILLNMKDVTDRAEPNDAHMALTQYQVPVITMNIDSLHTRAGSRKVLEVHGHLRKVYCPSCQQNYDFGVIRQSINCQHCGSIFQPRVVLYGDMIRHYVKALDWIGQADNVLVVGTSFLTSTVNEFVAYAKHAGMGVSIINEKAETHVRQFLQRCALDEN